MSIKAFGKTISRDEAYQLIVNDYISNIIHAHNTDILEDIIVSGWKGIDEWSDKSLEELLADFCIENQPLKVQKNHEAPTK